ncbi:hypothetical protein [Cronobacter sakazakii]|uniref:hypothetical protein n=1 Tax=Cronobacter sakazakii TaxID=28141 RepID=UPI001F5140FC|nr:hypothetical protein [Cronobacter sakazakii]MCI0323046.1 hypothetical protein [Cronobacter sakazakii]
MTALPDTLPHARPIFIPIDCTATASLTLSSHTPYSSPQANGESAGGRQATWKRAVDVERGWKPVWGETRRIVPGLDAEHDSRFNGSAGERSLS